MYIICNVEPLRKVYNTLKNDDYPFIKDNRDRENIEKDLSNLLAIINETDKNDSIGEDEFKDLSADTLLDIAIELYMGESIDYVSYNKMLSEALSRF